MDPVSLGPLLSVFGNISMFVGGVAVTVWVVKSVLDSRNGKRTHTSESVASAKLHQETATALTAISQRNSEAVTQLGTISNSLTLVAERLGNLPTRAEVMGDLRGEIRHDIHDKVQPLATEVENLDKSVVQLTEEMRRRKR